MSLVVASSRGLKCKTRERETMVDIMDARRVVSKMNLVDSGGSSRILSIALRAESCILSAFSSITVLRLPKGLSCAQVSMFRIIKTGGNSGASASRDRLSSQSTSISFVLAGSTVDASSSVASSSSIDWTKGAAFDSFDSSPSHKTGENRASSFRIDLTKKNREDELVSRKIRSLATRISSGWLRLPRIRRSGCTKER